MTITTPHEIVIGKNRHHNTELVRAASPHDLWFHVANKPSPHLILKVPVTTTIITRTLLKQCALLCKSKSSFKSIPKLLVHYTKISNLQCTEIPGKVLILNPHLVKTITV